MERKNGYHSFRESQKRFLVSFFCDPFDTWKTMKSDFNVEMFHFYDKLMHTT